MGAVQYAMGPTVHSAKGSNFIHTSQGLTNEHTTIGENNLETLFQTCLATIIIFHHHHLYLFR